MVVGTRTSRGHYQGVREEREKDTHPGRNRPGCFFMFVHNRGGAKSAKRGREGAAFDSRSCAFIRDG